jgi:hypothetical protein
MKIIVVNAISNIKILKCIVVNVRSHIIIIIVVIVRWNVLNISSIVVNARKILIGLHTIVANAIFISIFTNINGSIVLNIIVIILSLNIVINQIFRYIKIKIIILNNGEYNLSC